ncbi:MAG: ABC transporter substrate-binding protein [Caldilineaceae bacterium]|nr:ABC transporter substrate-binding protein [Caldilineaceae bacterium]
MSATGTLATLWVLDGCGRTSTAELETPPAPTEAATIPETAEAEDLPPVQSLHIAFANVPLQFDPAVMSANAAIQVAFAVYEGLVWVDQDLTIQPALADSWEASDDLLSWTFKLRQDVEFHHGALLTAQDVVYTFGRLLDPAIGSPLRSVLSFIASVDAVDDGTPAGAVRFTLTSANADLPLLCGAPQALILSHEYDIELLPNAPSGTGPFRVDELVPGQYIRFIRNESYWAAAEILLQEVYHIYTPSFDDRAAALSAGEVDLLPDISGKEAALLAVEEAIEIAESPSGAYQTVVMQATEAPFDDVRVRQALKLCIDRAAVRDALLGGRGEIALDHPVASISPFHADLPARQQNIEQARQLLLDAGYPDGIQLDLITANVDPGMVELAQLVQAMAAPAGFDISPTEVPSDVYWNSYWRQVPFHIGSWNFRPSIDETFALAFRSDSIWNESRWYNADLDALLDAARSEPHFEQRKAFYRQAQQMIMEEGAVIIPVFRPVLTAMHKRVQGFVPHPAGWISLRNVQIVEQA